MKIYTTITARVERSDGTSVTLERTTRVDAGDNPRFERVSVRDALSLADDDFAEFMSLSGTKPL